MNYLVTGSSGFIGYSLAKRLLSDGHCVVGIDNHNDYYDVKLKEARKANLSQHQNFTHSSIDISNYANLQRVFREYEPRVVINLAAQAGVRYSIENPHAYVNSNIVGFTNVLECCREFGVEHLIYASSSSVYGGNRELPFSTKHNVNHPLSIYAATKRSNELFAHCYSSLFDLPTTGLRFFTVYGPWGRPDMALFKFTEAILSGRQLDVFNYGKHKRDFTYVDDIVESIVRLISCIPSPSATKHNGNLAPFESFAPWRIFNIGNNNPVDLLDYIEAIEEVVGKKAQIRYLPLQVGDVEDTFADIEDLVALTGYRPKTSVQHGVSKFVSWYRDYYQE